MPQPKENSPIKRDILFRVHLLYAAFVLIAALVFARLIWVQLFSSEVAYNAERLEGRIFTDEIIPARRGNILTRDGEPLATSLFRYQVEMDYGSPGFDSLRTFREQSDSLAKLLALYFRDKSAAAYAQTMQREHARRYRVTYRKDTLVPRSEGGLARWWDRMRGEEFLTVKLYDTLRDHTPVALFPREIDYTEWQTLRRYPILNWNMGMTYRLRERDERVYPQGELARRTIGQVGDKGNYGVEYVLRDVLEGRDGKARRQRIARGFYGRVVGGDNSEPEDGLDVVTTLDLEMQDVADRALRRQLEAQNALWGTALVMEVATGDLLAMANLSRTKSGAYAIGGLVTGNNWLDRTTKTLKNTTTLNITMLENRLRLTGDFSFRTKDYTETKKTTAIPYSAYEGEIVYLGTPETDDVMKESLQLTTYMATNAYAEFEDTFAEKHYFKALAGYNYEQQDYKSTYSERNGLLMPDADNINFALGDIMSITAGGSRWRYVGAFFRFNYAYDDRYLLEVNGRYDGSSKFPNNSQWGFFPSASAAWRVSQEKFWNVSPMAVSNLKVRASYGALGNSNVDPYTYLETFGLSTFGTGSGDAARYLFGQAKLRYTSLPGQIPDNIGWETSKTFDVGLDAGFLNGRLNLTADYYIRKTVDMYTVGPTLPDTFGATAPKGNYADMSTYGYEIALSYNDSFKLAGKPFNFGIKATLADYYSIIDRYNNASRKLSDYYEGQRLGEIWGFVCNGLFQSQAEIDAAFGGKGYKNDIMQTSEKYITYPGDMRFEDLNGNDAIDRGSSTVDDPGDRKIIGNSEPRYLYTISLNADWNGFFLSALFDGVGRQQWFPSDESLFWGMYNRPYNQVPTWHLQNYWTEERPNAYLPRYVGYYGPMNANTVNVNTRYLQDVSYIRLKNLQFGYELPKRWISKIGLSKVSVYFSGENLWSWSPLYRHTKDFDVTVASKKSDSDISNSKGDGHNYPVMRSFSFGISITY